MLFTQEDENHLKDCLGCEGDFESLDVGEIIVENLFVVKLYIFEDNEETVS